MIKMKSQFPLSVFIVTHIKLCFGSVRNTWINNTYRNISMCPVPNNFYNF